MPSLSKSIPWGSCGREGTPEKQVAFVRLVRPMPETLDAHRNAGHEKDPMGGKGANGIDGGKDCVRNSTAGFDSGGLNHLGLVLVSHAHLFSLLPILPSVMNFCSFLPRIWGANFPASSQERG